VNRLILTTALITLGATRASAQDPLIPHGRAFWVAAGATLAASLTLDEPVQRFVAAHQRHTLIEVAHGVDPLGEARYLVPSLVVVTAVPYVAGRHALARSALRVGLGYAAADIAGGIVRASVARHRPDAADDAFRFRPLRPQGEWGSMPSAHVTHAFAIAAGIAEVSGRPWVADVAYGLATLVAADRVYQQRHWTSDTVVGAVLAVSLARRVDRLLADGCGRYRRRRLGVAISEPDMEWRTVRQDRSAVPPINLSIAPRAIR
jgi:membrane-associated phospholipid phosphatase